MKYYVAKFSDGFFAVRSTANREYAWADRNHSFSSRYDLAVKAAKGVEVAQAVEINAHDYRVLGKQWRDRQAKARAAIKDMPLTGMNKNGFPGADAERAARAAIWNRIMCGGEA